MPKSGLNGPDSLGINYNCKTMNVLALIKLGVVAIGAGAGAYFGSYLKKKGENLATHEDIDKLIKQVAAVTQTTKEIETRISNEVWDRQKQWELKKETIFELGKRVSGAKDALSTLYAVYSTDKNSKKNGGPERPEKQQDAAGKCNEALNRLDEAHLSMDLVCEKALSQTSGEFLLFVRNLAQDILAWNPEKFEALTPQLGRLLKKLNDAMRNELGIQEK
jgi:hypothetical protein